MLAPVDPKRIRKAVKGLRRRLSTPCPRGELLRLLIAEADPDVPILRPDAEDRARLEFIVAGKTYCVVRCGGCALTEGWRPPA